MFLKYQVNYDMRFDKAMIETLHSRKGVTKNAYFDG